MLALVSREQSATTGRMQVLRATTYFVGLLVASTATLLAFADSSLPDVTRITLAAVVGLVIVAVLMLLVHQPIGRMSAVSAILVALAFILPATLVHETSKGGLCGGGPTPCDPGMNSHVGLRVGLMAVLLFASLVSAAVGLFRSSRLTHTPDLRRRSLAHRRRARSVG
jgi:hypothetical protein